MALILLSGEERVSANDRESVVPQHAELCTLAVTTTRRHVLLLLSQTLTTVLLMHVILLGRSPARRKRKRQRADSFPTNGTFVWMFLVFHVQLSHHRGSS